MKLIDLLKQLNVPVPEKKEHNHDFSEILSACGAEYDAGFNSCHDLWANIEVKEIDKEITQKEFEILDKILSGRLRSQERLEVISLIEGAGFRISLALPQLPTEESIKSMEEFQIRYFPKLVGKECPYCGNKLKQS